KIRSIRAYLYTSLRRKVLTKAAERRKFLFLESQHDFFLKQETSSPEHRWMGHEKERKDVEKLQKALSELSDHQREIIFLRFHARLDYSEIARIMSIDRKSAYNLMARTLVRLKKLIVGA